MMVRRSSSYIIHKTVGRIANLILLLLIYCCNDGANAAANAVSASSGAASSDSLFLPDDVFNNGRSSREVIATDFEAMLAALDRSHENNQYHKQQQQQQQQQLRMEPLEEEVRKEAALGDLDTYNRDVWHLGDHDGEEEGDGVGRLLQEDRIGFCFDALYLADENKDSKVDQDEFVTFVQIMGPPGFLTDVGEFADLPLIMQSNFIILACLCLQQPGADPTCCTENPHINNNGTWPGQVPTPEQEDYLFQVCYLTETSIDRVLASQAPSVAPQSPTTSPTSAQEETPSPTEGDKDTPSPTAVPTRQPTSKPTTKVTPQPTAEPTDPPVVATPEPTDAPTLEPTVETPAPVTKEPTEEPEPVTSEPTPVASQEPSTGPPPVEATGVPSATPTVKPVEETDEPTLSPSVAPTPGATTTAPTTKAPTTPAPSTAAPTTKAPSTPEPSTSEPTGAPPPLISDQTVFSSYEIAVKNGTIDDVPPSTYVPDLVAAMNLLAQRVEEVWMDDADNTSPPPALRRLLRSHRRTQRQQQGEQLNHNQRRRLSATVKVNIPTEIDEIASTDCPAYVDLSIDRCENVLASIPLIVVVSGNGTEAEAVAAADSYLEDLNTAIEEGFLQETLAQVNPDSVVFVTSGMDRVPPTPTEAPTDDISSGGGLSTGAIAGIVVGCVALLAGSGIALSKKRRREKVDDPVDDLKDIEGAEMEGATGADGDLRGPIAGGVIDANCAYVQAEPKADEKNGSPSKKKKSSSSGALYHVPGAKRVSDEGSSAGESGWSSNQDVSSVDSKSLDSNPSPNPIYIGDDEGAALAGVDSDDQPTESNRSDSNRSLEAQPPDPNQDYSQPDTDTGLSLQSTYSELDQAIQKGDWAAVGVTAALLASQAYSTEDDSTAGSSKPKVLEKASLNPQRAAELDALVEAGDWEGVVAAAAKFDAQEAIRGGGNDSQVGSGSQHSMSYDSPSVGSVGGSSTGTGRMSASATIESTVSPSIGTATGMTLTSDTASTRSKSRKLNEIREEVEALVNAVVPEEADNVDEMMTQFRGREEELVETLRSMQERQIAQKARLESQKQAKRDARAYAAETRQQGKDAFGAVDNTGSPADEEWMQDIENAETPTAPDTTDSLPVADAGAILGGTGGTMEPPREEDEDQEAMAMKDQLMTAIEKEDWENVAEAASGLSGHATDFNDLSRADSDSPSNESVRSQEINSLVDKGDWDGVVAAASRYVESDKKLPHSTSDGDTDSSIEDRRRRRQERLKEEEEALAQAEIWDAIAEQARSESMQEETSANVPGANLAAAWAIDRSLSALRKAEEDEQGKTPGKKKEDEDDPDREV